MKIITSIFIITVLFSAHYALAAGIGTCNPDNPSSTICNPISSGAHGNIPGFISYAISFVGGFIGLIAICLIVYAGFRMIIANGDDTAISNSKKILTRAIFGFVAAIMAYSIVLAIQKFLGVQNVDYSKQAYFTNPFAATSLQGFASKLLEDTVSIGGLLALLMIILSGFRYMVSRGDEKTVSKAKNTLTWSVLGLVIMIFAYVIIKAVATLLGK